MFGNGNHVAIQTSVITTDNRFLRLRIKHRHPKTSSKRAQGRPLRLGKKYTTLTEIPSYQNNPSTMVWAYTDQAPHQI
jgi:hypothetical protein